MFIGNFTPSGHTVKVTSGHKVAKMEGFTFVVFTFFIVLIVLFKKPVSFRTEPVYFWLLTISRYFAFFYLLQMLLFKVDHVYSLVDVRLHF